MGRSFVFGKSALVSFVIWRVSIYATDAPALALAHWRGSGREVARGKREVAGSMPGSGSSVCIRG